MIQRRVSLIEFENKFSNLSCQAPSELVRQARRWLLNVVKQRYWNHFEEGLLRREGVMILVSAAAEAADNWTIPIAEWDNTLKFWCETRRSMFLRFRQKGGLPEFVKRYIAVRLFASLAITVDVCQSFISAHKEVLQSLPTLVTNETVATQLTEVG